MELHPDTLSAFRLHKAYRLIAVKSHLRIRSIVANEDVVLPGEFYDLLEKVQSSDSTGGIVGIVNPQEPGILQDKAFNAFQIGEKAVLRRDGQIVRSTTRQLRAHHGGERGSGTKAISPLSIKQKAIWPMPSLEPM